MFLHSKNLLFIVFRHEKRTSESRPRETILVLKFIKNLSRFYQVSMCFLVFLGVTWCYYESGLEQVLALLFEAWPCFSSFLLDFHIEENIGC